MKESFFRVAFPWDVIRRSLVIAVVVVVILVAINHSRWIWLGEFYSTCALQSGLTLLVAYCVSVVSCVSTCAARENESEKTNVMPYWASSTAMGCRLEVHYEYRFWL